MAERIFPAQLAQPGKGSTGNYNPLLLALLAVMALLLALSHIHNQLAGAPFWPALARPDVLAQQLVRDSILPRIVMTWLCGIALALAGTLAQQVLRNPLAEPMTLGVFPGAWLALSIAAVWAPDWLIGQQDLLALAGGGGAMLLVFGLAWRQRMTPLAVILAGMVVSLYCGALNMALAVSSFNLMRGLMIWGGGALDQTGWTASVQLTLRIAPCLLAVLALRQPLAVFDAGETTARSLGINIAWTRFVALLLAVALTAFVVAAVGVIGFIGLAAPTLARLAGARRLTQRLWWAPLLGAALLWLTDELVQRISAAELFSAWLIPTGTVTALLGVPLLLCLLPRLRAQPELSGAIQLAPVRPARWRRWLLLLPLAIALSLFVSRGMHGWSVLPPDALLWLWRLPHAAAAVAAGLLLGTVGALLQRLTGNALASPDLLGVSAGGALGMVLILFALPDPGAGMLFAACLIGALATLALLLWLGGRAAFAPARLLLIGIALSALFQSVVSAVMSSGDPRAGVLINFVVGSTYYIEPATAWSALVIALLGMAVAPLCGRWLDTLALGLPTAVPLGVPVARARCCILLLAAVLTAASTLLVGPLSFVGLIAPHIARLAGARRTGPQLLASALIGAALMTLAEWLSRQLLFPQEMPTGLVASLLGAPCLVLLIWHRRA